MTKTLYLMRHGQILFNKRYRIQGWCDAPLTPLERQVNILRMRALFLMMLPTVNLRASL